MTGMDFEHLRSWIGREEISEGVVTPELVARYQATLALPGPAPQPGEPAPRFVHFCLGQPAVAPAGLGQDGHPARGGFLPPVSLPRRMWAAGALTFHDEIRVGETMRRSSRIVDVAVKQGRSSALVFVTVSHAIHAGGRAILDERQDIVYRDQDKGVAAAPANSPAPAPSGAHSRVLDTSTTTLFRYSALTFNGHRIHYDRRYAIEVEGYRGLVVHGPMQAAVLHDFAAELKGALPRRFAFRGLSPLIDDDLAAMHAEADGGSMRLWTAAEGGPVAMSAEAHW